MNEIIVRVYTSDQAEKFTKLLLERGEFVAYKAIIHYSCQHGLPASDYFEGYPLVLEGTMNGTPARARIFSVSAGYAGTGPHAMVNILKTAGFEFDENDIFTRSHEDPVTNSIDLVYTR